MDKQSKDVIGSVLSLTQDAKEFQSYAVQSRDDVEQRLLRSPLSWEVLADEALHFPGRLDHALERLNERISKLKTEKKEAEETLKGLRKLHPVPGTDEFVDCEHEGHVAQLVVGAAQATLLELQRARDSVPKVDAVKEGVAAVLEVALPHIAEELRRTLSVEASRIQSVVTFIDGKVTQYEELVAATEAEVGKKLECPTFHRNLLDQLKAGELVELRG